MESNSTNSTPATTGYHLEIDSGSELSANQNKTNGNDSETPRSSKRTTETAQTTTTTTSSSFVVGSSGNNDSSSRRSSSSPSRRNKTRRISSTEGIGTSKPPPLPASNSILKVALQNWLPARYDVEKQKEDNKNNNNNNKR